MESLPPKLPLPARTSSSQPTAPSEDKHSPRGPSFKSVLEGLGQRIDQGERLVQQVSVAKGGDEASRLIALQAGIYRYSEAIDLSAKLVDRASSAVKTTLQSQ